MFAFDPIVLQLISIESLGKSEYFLDKYKVPLSFKKKWSGTGDVPTIKVDDAFVK